MTSIKILRVVTGEVIIAETAVHDDGSVTVIRPALMQMQMVDEGKIGVAMIPYHPWMEGPIMFYASSLIGPPNDADTHTARGYDKRFNPNAIVVPGPAASGLLLG